MVKKRDTKGEMETSKGESEERSQKRVKRGGSVRRYATRNVETGTLAQRRSATMVEEVATDL